VRDYHYLTRKSFIETLEGNISIDGDEIEVLDEQAGSSDIYIICSSQNLTENSTFSHFSGNEFIMLEIVHKQDSSTTKKIVDDIADQILQLVKPTPSTNGLVAQAGVQFLNVQVYGDRHVPFNLNDAETIIRRLLRFSLQIYES
jgi:hypothetical protein